MQEPTENTQQILIEPERTLPDFTFDELPEAMRAPLEAMGWRAPMPVQAKAIPYLLDMRDMIVQSRTGSGKTGAFMMPLIMRIDQNRRHPQALVLVPTRELAMQVHKEFLTLTQNLNVTGALLYGGVGYQTQLQALRDGAQVIIGTPGRVLDHIGRRSLNLDRLHILVFDEADEMLSMGFYPDMRELRRYIPRERSSWMFSATMPYKVQMLAREFLREPEFLSLSAGNISVSTAEHRFYDVPPLEKDLMLMRLIEFENPESAIIFCNTKVDVEYLSTVLHNYGYNVDQLSGDLDQKSRERAMERIRRGETRFLVATDVAARGIDISDLSHVFQYDVPKDPDSYIHRAGRTARAGNTGVVVTLVANMSERSDMKKIARKYEVEFVELAIPTQEDVAARMTERLVVILEDRMRGLSRLERERLKRFNAIVADLAGNEDERGLLAMLLDEIYYTTYHQPAPGSAPEQPIEAPREERGTTNARESRNDSSRGGGPRGDGRRNDERGERRRSDEPRKDDRPPVADAHAAAPAGDVEGGEEKKKRKRKRKKKRGRAEGGAVPNNVQGQAESGAEPIAQGDATRDRQERADEQTKDAAPDRGRDERRNEARQRDQHRESEPRADNGARADDRGRAAASEPAAGSNAGEGGSERAAAKRGDAGSSRTSQERSGRGGRGRGRERDTEILLFDSIEVIEPDPVPPVAAAAPAPTGRSSEAVQPPDEGSAESRSPGGRGSRKQQAQPAQPDRSEGTDGGATGSDVAEQTAVVEAAAKPKRTRATKAAAEDGAEPAPKRAARKSDAEGSKADTPAPAKAARSRAAAAPDASGDNDAAASSETPPAPKRRARKSGE